MRKILFFVCTVIAIVALVFLWKWKEAFILRHTSESQLSTSISSVQMQEFEMATTSSSVFLNGWGAGWHDTSWKTKISTSTSVAKGISFVSMNVKYTTDWSGMYAQTNGFDPSQYKTLVIRFNIGSSENEDLYVSLYTGKGISLGTVPLVHYVNKNVFLPNTWYVVYIPIADISPSQKPITGVVIESAHMSDVSYGGINFISEKRTSKYVPPQFSELVQTHNQNSTSSNQYSTTPVTPSGATTGNTQTSSTPVLPSIAENIYQDSFLAGWVVESTKNIDEFSKNAQDGLYALKIDFTEPWSEVKLTQKNGVDVRGYEGIWLYIQGVRGGENVQCIFYGQDGTVLGTARIADFVDGRELVAGTYMPAYIPFRTISMKKGIVSKIILTSEKPATVFIDNFKFSGEPSVIPMRGYYVTAGTVFAGEAKNAWYFETWNATESIQSDSTAKYAYAVVGSIAGTGGGLYIKNTIGMRTYSYHHLKFAIKGPALSGPRISVALFDTHGGLLGSVWLTDFLEKSTPERTVDYSEYQNISIPLEDLGAEDVTVGSIVFSSEGATGSFSMDNIRFEF